MKFRGSAESANDLFEAAARGMSAVPRTAADAEAP